MRGSRALRAVLVCLLLVGASGVAVAGAGHNDETDARSAANTMRPFQQVTATPAENNSSVRHEDPNSVDESGNRERVQARLARSLAQRLQGSVVNLSQGEYEQARGLVDEEFREEYGKYVEVAGETAGNDGLQSLKEAQQHQRAYINRTKEYRETKDAYREAVRNGNQSRARALARELHRLAGQLNQTGQELDESYTGLANHTGANLSREQQTIDETTQNITTDADEIARSTFTETTLSVSITPESASFLNPATLSGRILTENGTAFANRTVMLAIAGQTLEVQIDASGRFTTLYRPTLARLDSERLNVSYVPDNTSVYLGSDASVPVSLTPVSATTDVTGPSTAAFDDTVTVRGRVAAESVPVADVPVRVTLGDVTLGTVRTNTSGTYTLSTTLPANVTDGAKTLTASVPLTERALTSEPTGVRLRVKRTETRLNANATVTDEGTTRVAGRLETVDGTPIAARSVDVRLDGTVIATVETDEQGRFVRSVELPASLESAEQATVAVSFDGSGTSLDTAATETTLRLAAPDDERTPGLLRAAVSGDGIVVGGAGLLALFSGVALFLFVRDDGPASVASSSTPTVESGQATSDDVDTDPHRARLKRAEHHLDDDTTVAVELGFAAVRGALESRYSVSPSMTHREFVAACRAGGLADGAADDLETLADVYERAVFAPTDVSKANAALALEHAESLLSR